MRKFAGTAVLLGVLALASAGTSAQQSQHEHGQAAKSGTAQQSGDVDLRFIDMTVMHHQMGVKMSQLAEQKAANTELKTKAGEMAREQQRDIDELQQLRTRLYPNAPKHEMGGMDMPGHDMGAMGGQGTSGQMGSEHQHGAQSGGQMSGMGMMDQMKRLENLSGAAFDREFAKDMIQHHQMQIRMSERAVKEAKHDEVRDFAQKTVADQKKDIGDLKKFEGPASSK